jgi:tetratricopeptide (TPR) repeat protein
MFKYNLVSILAFGIFSLISQSSVFSQDGQGGTESNLSKGYGARAMGLGNAFTAMADDPTAVFWNPAGLEFMYQRSVTLFHTSFWEGTSYDFLGYAHPTLKLGTFGVGIGRIGVGGIPWRDNSGLEIGKFSFEEMQFYFSYAKRLPYNFTPGITFRLLHRGWSNLFDTGDLADTGLGIDLGLMYRPEWFGSPLFQDWAFGLKIHNFLSPSINEGADIDDFPISVRLGLLKKVRFVGGQYFNAVMDFDYSQKRDLRLHMGAEYRFRELGEIRLGFDAGGISFGAGVEYNIVQFDYAYGYDSDYSDYFSAVHRISLTFNFGYTRDELFVIAEEERLADEERLIEQLRIEESQHFVADHMKIGDEYFAQQRFLDAIVEYQQVISRDSSNTYAQVMLDSANVLLQQDVNKGQAIAVQDALDKERARNDATFVNERFERGLQQLDQGLFTEALIEFNMALERDPENTTVKNAVRTANRRINEEIARLIDESRSELENQNYSEAMVLLSDARSLGSGTSSQKQEINVLTTQINVQRTVQRGLLLYQIGEYQQALQVFEEILALDPENGLAKEYYEKVKIETVGKDTKMDPRAERKYLEGMNEFLSGNYSRAIAIWDSILIEQPYNKKVLQAVQGARERIKQNSK